MKSRLTDILVIAQQRARKTPGPIVQRRIEVGAKIYHDTFGWAKVLVVKEDRIFVRYKKGGENGWLVYPHPAIRWM